MLALLPQGFVNLLAWLQCRRPAGQLARVANGSKNTTGKTPRKINGWYSENTYNPLEDENHLNRTIMASGWIH